MILLLVLLFDYLGVILYSLNTYRAERFCHLTEFNSFARQKKFVPKKVEPVIYHPTCTLTKKFRPASACAKPKRVVRK